GLSLRPHELVDGLHHVNGDADRPCLVGDGPGDGLADPPGGIGRELEALRVVELVDGPHEPEVPLLDQVQEQHSPVAVTLGDGDHKPKVGLDELFFGLPPVEDDPLLAAAVGEGDAVRAVGRLPAGPSWSSAGPRSAAIPTPGDEVSALFTAGPAGGASGAWSTEVGAFSRSSSVMASTSSSMTTGSWRNSIPSASTRATRASMS